MRSRAGHIGLDSARVADDFLDSCHPACNPRLEDRPRIPVVRQNGQVVGVVHGEELGVPVESVVADVEKDLHCCRLVARQVDRPDAIFGGAVGLGLREVAVQHPVKEG